MISGNFLKGRGRERLSLEEQTVLEGSIAEVRVVSARKALIRKGEPLRSCTLLLEGFIYRSVDDRQGRRQIVGIHVPGDFIDLDSSHLKRLDHDIFTIGITKIAIYDHDTLTHLSERFPHLVQVLWFSTLLHAAMHREWIFRLGRLGAEARIAHLFCELYARLEMVDLVQNKGFELPLTQADLGEATGLTSVHVNRVLRSLRERDLLSFTNRRVVVHDKTGLEKVACFEPHFLCASRCNE